MDKRLEACLNGTVTDKAAADQNAYLKRVAHMLAEGAAYADVLVLAQGNVNETAERLESAAITFEMLPTERLWESDGIERIGECGTLVVPHSTEMSFESRERLDELAYGGILVFFVGDEPEAVDENGVIFEGMGPVIAVRAEDLAGMIRILDHAHFTPSRKYKALRFRHLQRGDADIYFFLNTSGTVCMGFTFDAGRTDVLLYDPVNNRLSLPKINGGQVRVQIKPGSSLFVIGGTATKEYQKYI
ncbi:MAG: hypothetical protein J6D21_05020 [Clostridia bacterium]|nr:hypothetical protein [Clostridia bacterium]